jgi:hypothetical protein
MNRFLSALVVVAAVSIATQAQAQVYQVYYPAPVATYYAPAPVAVAPAPVAVAPAPVAVAPAPVTVYYPSYPTAVATTRYRPLLGGTITRWRYVDRPTYVYPSTVAYYPAW